MPSVVLITGVSRFVGGRLAAQLAADPAIDRVIGIDTVPPRSADLGLLGRTEFVRADIRNPLIAKVMSQARVQTVVHSALISVPREIGGRVSMQEMNVIGTMQLLAACQKSDTVQRVVLRSTTAVYGSGASDPAVFTEDMEPHGAAPQGYAKDAAEVEGYVRAFGRRRPDVEISVLRLAPVVGPTIDTALTRYLRSRIVPTVAGFDPRLQLLHESDAIEAMRLAAVHSRPGVVNVAADGVVSLSQLVRRAGRVRLPVPLGLGPVAGLVRNSGAAEFVAEEGHVLRFGRVVDTTRLHTEFGYHPHWTTAEAVDACVSGGPPIGRLTSTALRVGSEVLAGRRSGQRRKRVAVTGT